jgi:hypothetical protein
MLIDILKLIFPCIAAHYKHLEAEIQCNHAHMEYLENLTRNLTRENRELMKQNCTLHCENADLKREKEEEK